MNAKGGKPPDGTRGFKKTIDLDDTRRKREANSVQLRKEKKEDSLQKRRRDVDGARASAPEPRGTVGTLPDPGIKAKVDNIPEDVVLLNSSDPAIQLDATIRFRKLLSIERNPPIAEVIAAGVVPRLVQFLQCYDDHTLAFEATWALTNIASGTSEHARVVIDYGAVPIFVRLMAHPSGDVREQSMWALGNIAGDSCRCRDLVLSYNALTVLLQQCQMEGAPLTLLRNATWTISNLCRGKTPPRWELIAPALPLLTQLIASPEDEEVVTDCCWALSYLTDPPDRVQAIIDCGALPHLVGLLGHKSPAVQSPALRAVGTAVAGNAVQTQAVLECGGLARFGELLMCTKKEIRKESCWAISNLSAGSTEQVTAVFSAGLMPRLLDMVATEEFEIKKEAAYSICNACCAGVPQIVATLVAMGAVSRLCDLLELPDAHLLLSVLEALEAILRAGAALQSEQGLAVNPYTRAVDEAGGCEKIEALQMHENHQVFAKAAQLIETFFGTDDEEDALIAPVATADGFSFNMEA